MKETDTFESTATGKSYRVHAFASWTCKTKCVVYLIECTNCEKQYVGMTTRALHKRFNEHMSDIMNKRTRKTVAEHFNLPGHSMEDLTIMVIDQEDDITTLREQERYWINKLGTKAHGLNRR